MRFGPLLASFALLVSLVVLAVQLDSTTTAPASRSNDPLPTIGPDAYCP
jgi:hypothetical protein